MPKDIFKKPEACLHIRCSLPNSSDSWLTSSILYASYTTPTPCLHTTNSCLIFLFTCLLHWSCESFLTYLVLTTCFMFDSCSLRRKIRDIAWRICWPQIVILRQETQVPMRLAAVAGGRAEASMPGEVVRWTRSLGRCSNHCLTTSARPLYPKMMLPCVPCQMS